VLALGPAGAAWWNIREEIMRRVLLSLVAAAVLSGCASTLQNVYDKQALSECDQIGAPSDRSSCYDRVAQNRRERR
jgi:hypothetical protein